MAAVPVGVLLLAVIAGAPDSPLVPLLPAGVSPASWLVRTARWIGVASLGRETLTVLSLAVMAGMIGAWVGVLTGAAAGRVSVRAVAIAGTLAVILAVAAPVLLSRDVYSYAAYGRILAVHRHNPYLMAPSAFPSDPFVVVASPAWADQPSLYGPLFVGMAAAIARMRPDSAGAAIIGFKALSGAALLGAGLVAVGIARRIRPARRSFVAACLVLNPVLLVHAVGGGHNDTLVALLLAAGAAFAVRGSAGSARVRSLATVAICLAGLVKLSALIILPLWLWSTRRSRPGREGWRRAGAQTGLAALVLIGLSLPFAAGGKAASPFGTLGSLEGWASGVRLVARGAEAVGGALASGWRSPTGAAVRGLFLAAFGLLLWRIASRSHPDRAAGDWGTGELAFALSVPYLLPWYTAWFAPFLGLIEDDVVASAGVALSAVLALTGIPAEPGSSPALWRGMVDAVHWIAAPIDLALLGVVAWRVSGFPRRRSAPATQPPGA